MLLPECLTNPGDDSEATTLLIAWCYQKISEKYTSLLTESFRLRERGKSSESCAAPFESNREQKKEGGAKMPENLIYADLNLPQSTSPRQQTTDTPGRSIWLHSAFFVLFSLLPTCFERVSWSTKATTQTKQRGRSRSGALIFYHREGHCLRSAFRLLRCKGSCKEELLV